MIKNKLENKSIFTVSYNLLGLALVLLLPACASKKNLKLVKVQPVISEQDAGKMQAHVEHTPNKAPQNAAQAIPLDEYYVKSGDSLWQISENLLGSGHHWRQLLETNPQLSSPESLEVGTILHLPERSELRHISQKPVRNIAARFQEAPVEDFPQSNKASISPLEESAPIVKEVAENNNSQSMIMGGQIKPEDLDKNDHREVSSVSKSKAPFRKRFLFYILGALIAGSLFGLAIIRPYNDK